MMTKIMAKAYLWLLLILLYSPILIIMIFSFTEAKVLGNWTDFQQNCILPCLLEACSVRW